ncbi:uncharacterized protein PG998_014298 [Apiospora kogelbergensis]|uniref:uncharacterized protein n=1 Tax=Apiospora kogelbergensis TaxID=1337665 RepID=UPI00312E3370
MSSLVVEFTTPEPANRLIHSQGRWSNEYHPAERYDKGCRMKQCLRCQQYGHITTQCAAAHDTCGYCAGIHDSRNCHVRISPVKQPPKCALCKGVHTAHSIQCEHRQREHQRVHEALQNRPKFWPTASKPTPKPTPTATAQAPTAPGHTASVPALPMFGPRPLTQAPVRQNTPTRSPVPGPSREPATVPAAPTNPRTPMTPTIITTTTTSASGTTLPDTSNADFSYQGPAFDKRATLLKGQAALRKFRSTRTANAAAVAGRDDELANTAPTIVVAEEPPAKKQKRKRGAKSPEVTAATANGLTPGKPSTLPGASKPAPMLRSEARNRQPQSQPVQTFDDANGEEPIQPIAANPHSNTQP